MLKSITMHLIRVHSHSQSSTLFSICAAEGSEHLNDSFTGPVCEKEVEAWPSTGAPTQEQSGRQGVAVLQHSDREVHFPFAKDETNLQSGQNTDFSLNVLNKELHPKRLLKAKQTLWALEGRLAFPERSQPLEAPTESH